MYDDALGALLAFMAAAAWHFAVFAVLFSALLALAFEAILQLRVRQLTQAYAAKQMALMLFQENEDYVAKLYPNPDERPFRSTKILGLDLAPAQAFSVWGKLGLIGSVFSLLPAQLSAQLSSALQNAADADPVPKELLFVTHSLFGSSQDAHDAILLTRPMDERGELTEERGAYLRQRLALACERRVDQFQVSLQRYWQAIRILTFFAVALAGTLALMFSAPREYRSISENELIVTVVLAIAVSVIAPALHQALTSLRRR